MWHFWHNVCIFVCIFSPKKPVSSHPSSLLKLQHLWLMEIVIFRPKRNFNKNIVGKVVKNPCSLPCLFELFYYTFWYAVWECIDCVIALLKLSLFDTSEVFRVPNSRFQNKVGNLRSFQKIDLCALNQKRNVFKSCGLCAVEKLPKLGLRDMPSDWKHGFPSEDISQGITFRKTNFIALKIKRNYFWRSCSERWVRACSSA